ncbi:MAG TPA: GNAT family N-acetyltransferase [Candidatus Eisenbacteria bacterium]
MKRLTLETRRLILVAATEDLAAAELRDRARFAALLGARVHASWPPPSNDEGSMAFLFSIVAGKPGVVGFAHWYWLLRTETADGIPIAIGNGGFLGPPTSDGTVEVGYSVVEAFQRRGLATEAVAALIEWVFRDARVARVIAHAHSEPRASRRVLAKLAFARRGESAERGTIRFVLTREAWGAARGGAQGAAPVGAPPGRPRRPRGR